MSQRRKPSDLIKEGCICDASKFFARTEKKMPPGPERENAMAEHAGHTDECNAHFEQVIARFHLRQRLTQ